MKAITLVASLMAACSAAQLPPQAATQPVGYISIGPGELTPADGFFIATEDFRAKVLDDRMHDLDMSERLTKSESGRKASDARAAKGEFCLRWCLAIGGGVVLVVEGVALGIFQALRH